MAPNFKLNLCVGFLCQRPRHAWNLLTFFCPGAEPVALMSSLYQSLPNEEDTMLLLFTKSIRVRFPPGWI